MKDIIEQLQGEICLDDHIVQNYIFPYINSYGNDQNQIQKQNNKYEKEKKEIMVFMGEMAKVSQFCDIFLYQSSFFKSQTDTGQDLEQNTIFGVILSFWDSQAFENKWAVQKSQQENIQLFQEIANQVNQNINENIGLLYQILYKIVQIGGIKNQMKMIEWFNKAILLNHQKLRTFNEYNTQSQDSFTLNLLKLSTLVFKGLIGKFQHLKMMSNMVDCSILVEHQMGIFHQFSKLADFESADFEMVGPEIEGKLAEKCRILTHFLVICLQNVNLNSKVIQDLSFGFEEDFCQEEIITFFKAQSLLMDFEQIQNIFNCFCLLIFRAFQLNQVKIQGFKESFFNNGQIRLVQVDKEQIKDEISPIYSQLPDTFIENLYSILISLQQQQYLQLFYILNKIFNGQQESIIVRIIVFYLLVFGDFDGKRQMVNKSAQQNAVSQNFRCSFKFKIQKLKRVCGIVIFKFSFQRVFIFSVNENCKQIEKNLDG
ncbi:hypothetical protein PPERSA_09188 [Pseudocohnilembus persalinus]|uniref:Uncharacterized protein n=1 Tax=Pseudocohnilembus persalinus TaxID=266149 RepID=A0A0V0QMT9_PSEPJ|nr:hypothetical protein PPERSA_09188 [Pseudocohnilembus persalinus]|eukprot:KRX03280.1 hypothetical protein PPERSA_09188 [Pseudocohnilembus persalinus]